LIIVHPLAFRKAHDYWVGMSFAHLVPEINMGFTFACGACGDWGSKFRQRPQSRTAFTGFTFSLCPVLENRTWPAPHLSLAIARLSKFPLPSATTTVFNLSI
jgi:hypothetical protein